MKPGGSIKTGGTMPTMTPTILIVDDDRTSLYLLQSLLSEFNVVTAHNAAEMWAKLAECDPAAIVLDVLLPDQDGFQIARDLAANDQFRNIPVIFLTAKVEPGDVVTGFDIGGHDYIKKPFNGSELVARVRAVLRRSEERQRLFSAIIRDQQTGLFNRRHLADVTRSETNRIRRESIDYSAAMIDLDFFKAINDTHGHPCGDRVLAEFANVISATIRTYDMAFRYGGEEFLVLFSGIKRYEAMQAINRLRKKNNQSECLCNGAKIAVTFTCGISDTADVAADSDIINGMIDVADMRLRLGKETGRNRIVIENDPA